MNFRLRILPRAEKDAQYIFDYIADRTSEGALRWWNAFQHAAEKLIENPERFGFAPENASASYEVRQFLFKTRRGRMYRGIFTIVDEEIRILRVRGPGQPPLGSDEIPIE